MIWYKLPTATYTAYNQIGGASLYAAALWARDWTAQGYVGSLQRPGNAGVGGRVMEGDAPDAYLRSSRRQMFAHWDAPFVTLAGTAAATRSATAPTTTCTTTRTCWPPTGC